MRFRLPSLSLIAVSAFLLAAPAVAQFQSASYKFLQAVRESKNNEVIAALDEPGQTIVNTKDRTTGEGALHITVKRGDAAYTRYLLQKGADPNLRDGKGNTPMLLAVQFGQTDLVDLLILARANVNLANGSGVTPLILAVQKRDLTLASTLLKAGGDPDQTDVAAGMSARDYATTDTRSPAIRKLFDETPKKAKRVLSGPKM